MEYFRDKNGRLITKKQFNRAINHISFIEYFWNKICYRRNIRIVYNYIFKAYKQGKNIVDLNCKDITKEEFLDVIENLRLSGYNVNYSVSHMQLIIKLEEEIDYVSY